MDRHKRITIAADKGYDVASFVAGLRKDHVTPHMRKRCDTEQLTDARLGTPAMS
jgi:hypothetical protein